MTEPAAAAKRLRTIAEQLRKINPESDVKCHLQVLTGDAARIIRPHWKLVTERAGFSVEENPFPNGELRTVQAEREIWANTWLAIAIPLNFESIGRVEFGMPRLTETRLEDGTIDCVMQLNLDQWKPIAEDSARVCEYVAELLEAQPVTDLEGLLKADDPRAAEFRDGNEWCDAKYAKTLGISAKHIDRARRDGLYEVQLTARCKADSIGNPYVYRRAELNELAEAIPDEFKIGVEVLGNPVSKSPQKNLRNR